MSVQHIEHIYFPDSYVLSIEAKPYIFTMAFDFVLTPQHPFYSDIHPDDRHCYRRGSISIKNFKNFEWRNEMSSPPATDATGEIDFGNLDSFQYTNGVYAFEGDWGIIRVTGGELNLIYTE